jgi:hypothetical protein
MLGSKYVRVCHLPGLWGAQQCVASGVHGGGQQTRQTRDCETETVVGVLGAGRAGAGGED